MARATPAPVCRALLDRGCKGHLIPVTRDLCCTTAVEQPIAKPCGHVNVLHKVWHDDRTVGHNAVAGWALTLHLIHRMAAALLISSAFMRACGSSQRGRRPLFLAGRIWSPRPRPCLPALCRVGHTHVTGTPHVLQQLLLAIPLQLPARILLLACATSFRAL